MCEVNHALLRRILSTTQKSKDVQRLILFTFLAVLRDSCNCEAKTKIVLETMKQIKQIKHIKHITETRLYEAFSRQEVSVAWDKATAHMIDSYVRHNTRVAADKEATCMICMENVADFLFVHGSSAHGGICGGCALRVAMGVRPKCPMCNQRVKMVCARSSAIVSQLRVFDP